MIRHVECLDEWLEPFSNVVDDVPVLDPVLLRVHEFLGEQPILCLTFPATRGAGEWI